MSLGDMVAVCLVLVSVLVCVAQGRAVDDGLYGDYWDPLPLDFYNRLKVRISIMVELERVS